MLQPSLAPLQGPALAFFLPGVVVSTELRKTRRDISLRVKDEELAVGVAMKKSSDRCQMFLMYRERFGW